MSLGPIELLVVKIPQGKRPSDVVPALRQLVESGTIRVVDILVARKDMRGDVTLQEIKDLVEDEEYAIFNPVVSDITNLLSEDDVQQFSQQLEPGTMAALMLFEDVWATRFRDAIANAGGEVLVAERIPRAVIEDLISAPAG